MPICLICSTPFSNRVIIDGKERNLQNRKYCLICSPWGMHNNRKLHLVNTAIAGPNRKICSYCGEEKPMSEFRHGYKCKNCVNLDALKRQRHFKYLCLEYKGLKCQNCGYCRCPHALEFHHIDPSKKDFTIGRSRSLKFDDRIKKELDKCLLLCRNCHAETHYELNHGNTSLEEFFQIPVVILKNVIQSPL